jgi:hypothetical protein
MSRDAIREMKKTLQAGMRAQASEEHRLGAAQAALALLERSVRMGHRRLAVLRLSEAVLLGAQVPNEHWRYCQDAAAASRDMGVQTLFAKAVQVAWAGREKGG